LEHHSLDESLHRVLAHLLAKCLIKPRWDQFTPRDMFVRQAERLRFISFQTGGRIFVDVEQRHLHHFFRMTFPPPLSLFAVSSLQLYRIGGGKSDIFESQTP
jgi:hypothetical protein